jgi:hypothetical protein
VQRRELRRLRNRALDVAIDDDGAVERAAVDNPVSDGIGAFEPLHSP